MHALDLLQHRRSSKKFGDLAPTHEQLTQMFKAALRAPDHGKLKPYRFVVLQDRLQLKANLIAAAQEFQQGEAGLSKAEKLSQRAPCVVAAIAKLDDRIEKIPIWEQQISAGCATYGLQLAANALGFDTVWISKHWVKGQAIRSYLGCQANEQIIGLIMIGSPLDKTGISQTSETEEISNFVRYL